MVADKDADKRIFVKGFPHETTENDLKTFFETYGTVKHVNIVKDHKSGLAKYGFVTFESKDVRDTLCQEKDIKFREKTMHIYEAFRRQDFHERNGDSAAHAFRRQFSSRQLSLDYSSSTAPMAYYGCPFYNQNPVYVPAVQAPTVAQISSPSYQTSYIPSNPQVFMTYLIPGSPSTSALVQSLNSGEQFLLPMPRTSYVDGYTDYQTIPSITTLPLTPGNDWPSTESGMSIFAKESIPMSPKAKRKKSFQAYGTKDEEENSDAASEGSHVPIAAVLPTTKEIIGP